MSRFIILAMGLFSFPLLSGTKNKEILSELRNVKAFLQKEFYNIKQQCAVIEHNLTKHAHTEAGDENGDALKRKLSKKDIKLRSRHQILENSIETVEKISSILECLEKEIDLTKDTCEIAKKECEFAKENYDPIRDELEFVRERYIAIREELSSVKEENKTFKAFKALTLCPLMKSIENKHNFLVQQNSRNWVNDLTQRKKMNARHERNRE